MARDGRLTIDVELGRRIGSMSGVVGDVDECVSEKVGEDGAAEGAVFVEDFVAYVVLGDLALVSSHDGSDMVLDDASKRGCAGNS